MPVEHDKERNTLLMPILKIAGVVMFAALLITIIFRLNGSDSKNVNPDLELKQLASSLEQSAMNAHWKWQANQKPQRVLLSHYNEQGNEIGRTPVPMSSDGWPKVTLTSEGCNKLWQALMTEPMMVGEYKVYGEFYHASPKTGDAKCRFRLTSGEYFDYYIYQGKVIYNMSNNTNL